MLYWRYAAQALSLATVPLFFMAGYYQGKATHIDQQQIKEKVDRIFLGDNNTFWRRAILPPIRKITDGDNIIWYSTALKIPIAVYEKKKEKSVYSTVKHRLLEGFQPAFEQQSIPSYMANQLSSNPSPFASIYQNTRNLQDIWDTFSIYQKNLQQKCDQIQVVNGPIFTHDDPRDNDTLKIRRAHYDRVGSIGTSIPNKIFKIIRCKKNNNYYTSAFIFNNDDKIDNNQPLASYVVPIDTIEMKTGLSFSLPGSPLTDIDSETLNLTKQQYDRTILEGIVLKSAHFNELRQNYQRLTQHGITQSKQTQLLLKDTYRKQVYAIRTSQGIDECQRYWQYVRLRVPKMPAYLHEIDKQMKTLQIQALRKCQDLNRLDNIKQFLQQNARTQPELQSSVDDINSIILKQ